jgi:hypothetical protein
MAVIQAEAQAWRQLEIMFEFPRVPVMLQASLKLPAP